MATKYDFPVPRITDTHCEVTTKHHLDLALQKAKFEDGVFRIVNGSFVMEFRALPEGPWRDACEKVKEKAIKRLRNRLKQLPRELFEVSK